MVDSGAVHQEGGNITLIKHRAASLVAAFLLVLATASTAAAAPNHRQVTLLDNCDQASFDAALGPGACSRPGGGTTVDRLIEQLLTKGTAPSWRFSPSYVVLADGGTVTAVNRGGEGHTFTEVAEFGGGCVDELNQLLGLTPVDECTNPGAGVLFGTTLVLPGGSLTTGPLDSGTHRFMCIIHPWQRSTVAVD